MRRVLLDGELDYVTFNETMTALLTGHDAEVLRRLTGDQSVSSGADLIDDRLKRLAR